MKSRLDNVYFINGTAYAGKSTMVRLLADRHHGIACEENYHSQLEAGLDPALYPNLTWLRDLTDWTAFIRRTPDEYERWIDGVTLECARLERQILTEMTQTCTQKIFVDTNIPVEQLYEISDREHVLIMLADPEISVRRFFDRPDREKQFLYQLLMQEPDPVRAMANFRACLQRINSPQRHAAFMDSGFSVIHRDERRSVTETLQLVETAFGLKGV